MSRKTNYRRLSPWQWLLMLPWATLQTLLGWAVVVGSVAELGEALAGMLHDGDLLLMMGAGDIGAAAQQLARDGLPVDRAQGEQP